MYKKNQNNLYKEITVIGGAGHVGLAFALICVEKKIKVI